MSEDDTQTTAESEARGAELRENVALTDARRAEEEVAKAHEEVEAAQKKEEKLSRKEKRLREKAERVHAEADRQRAEAEAAAEAQAQTRATGTVSGAGIASPGVGATGDPSAQAAARGPGSTTFGGDDAPPATQRPEVLIGAAFAGSFIVARILKRIFD
jgi:septal ring factor EnvC (AmiA/AmiB activator)